MKNKRKPYYKHPERHMPIMITKTTTKTVPRVIYVLDEEQALAAMMRSKDKKK